MTDQTERLIVEYSRGKWDGKGNQRMSCGEIADLDNAIRTAVKGLGWKWFGSGVNFTNSKRNLDFERESK